MWDCQPQVSSGYFDFGEIPAPCNGKGFEAQSWLQVPRNIPCHARLCIRTDNGTIVIGTRFERRTEGVRKIVAGHNIGADSYRYYNGAQSLKRRSMREQPRASAPADITIGYGR